MKLLTGLLLSFVALAARADELTIERIFASPDLGGALPRQLKVSPAGDRVTFLRGKPEKREQLDLWEFHLRSRETRLLVDSQVLAPQESLSDEEKARRERRRMDDFAGIVEYQFSPDGKRLLFPLNGELYLYDLGRRNVRQLTHGEGFATDPQVSPRGRYVSFVRERNLWVIELGSGAATALTHDTDATISNGVAEFVASEEMARYTGYWWAPDDSALAFARIDESKVPVHERFEVHADRTDVVEQRYPAAGEANVAIELGVIAPQPDAKPRWIDLGSERDIYIARVDWLPDGKRLAYQRQSRDQRTLELVLVELGSGKQRTLVSETSDTWVNLHDDLRFLERQPAFLWSSERSGFRQLYLYGLDGALIRQVTDTPWPLDGVLGVDEKRDRVYAHAPGPDPLQQHAYAYPLTRPGKPERITTRDGWHRAVFSDDARVFVDYFADNATPTQVTLHAADGKRLTVLEANTLAEGHPYWPYAAAHRPSEFGSIVAAEGHTLYYEVIKPRGFDPGRRYPAVVMVYGGPLAQVVRRSFSGAFEQYLAQRGFVVFALDNRGSARRGVAFETAIAGELGRVEVSDQIEGAKWLRAQPWIDPARIGVFGWSYGGYMATQLLAKASDHFACGVAGAPVTDWRLYDTHYTERYLGVPQKNAEGYAKSSVFPWLDGLRSPLLLIHGMADDNVLFTNSTQLMAALQSRGVAFELMTYPGAKHGLSGQANSTHAYNRIAEFLERKLRPESVVGAAASSAGALERTGSSAAAQ